MYKSYLHQKKNFIKEKKLLLLFINRYLIVLATINYQRT